MTDDPQAELSILIPAHNEERVVGRLLQGLAPLLERDALVEILVLCNGCTDATADIAHGYPGVRVVELAESSKHAAMMVGEDLATAYPRLYVDADVELDSGGVEQLVAALGAPGILAVGPGRVVELSHSAALVRSYYRVWQRLPANLGLHGRGAICVSQRGHERLVPWPDLTADDLFVASRFGTDEYVVVAAVPVVVHAPRTATDLLRRRLRAARSNRQAASWTHPSVQVSASHLLSEARSPRCWPDLAIFVALTATSRIGARLLGRRLDRVWLRDESSRS